MNTTNKSLLKTMILYSDEKYCISRTGPDSIECAFDMLGREIGVIEFVFDNYQAVEDNAEKTYDELRQVLLELVDKDKMKCFSWSDPEALKKYYRELKKIANRE